MYINFRNFIY